jgi:hypothetical protein
MAMNDNKIHKEVNLMYVFIVYSTTMLRALALSHQIVGWETMSCKIVQGSGSGLT